jgi:hypothetical protein
MQEGPDKGPLFFSLRELDQRMKSGLQDERHGRVHTAASEKRPQQENIPGIKSKLFA